MKSSPYSRIPPRRWAEVTRRLLRQYPVSEAELVSTVLNAWADIFRSVIGRRAYRIGKQIRPEPQIMGFLLHELIPLHLAEAHPGEWRRGRPSTEPDALHVPDPAMSFEIKTSSSSAGIFGNRSYAQISAQASKRRGGYFLAINFGKFSESDPNPGINLVRFGWLDPRDWIGQKAPSGQ